MALVLQFAGNFVGEHHYFTSIWRIVCSTKLLAENHTAIWL